ncbi:ABC transporter substrate-binding protein [Microbacterium sp. VKM Ac-2923]|uniref:ABC transporter substrate-binding protein n=1 Tax=Microbacterium sp. VKM Ac-2923 TaxID=2929476 RepID=UPI001FB3C57B|nr:ABC transporter substrate-binding protein [Microbacterium sp. VKM Ac-2923]MCJ1706456.1 ABC transporter substrate-binding protein [Microbacterium sp. VKM Ac-2923]
MSVLSRSRTAKIIGGLAVVGVSALVLAGCSGSSTPAETGDAAGGDFPIDCNAAEPAAYTPEYSSSSTGPASGLTYNIGTALPVTGNLAFLGPPEIAGTEFAASEINAANKGVQINLIQGDSGDTDNKAYETEIPRLLGAGATAIVGAASSGTSLQFIDQVIAANAVQISPANTSAAFTGYDDKGLYWRTAPSDVLQGEVLGNLIASEGNETLGMIVLNDSYGTGLACFTKKAFENAGGSVVATSLYNTGDTNFSAQIEDVLAQSPDAIALITFDEVSTIIPDLTASVSPDKLFFVDGNLKNFGDQFPAGTLAGAKGTYPSVDPDSTATFRSSLESFWSGKGNPALEDFTYAPESYDSVVLLALAALKAGSAAGPDVAANLQSVSGGSGSGTKCTTYAECADIIVGGGEADYDGVSGPITFDEVGDPTEATIGVFEYGDDNDYSWLRAG